MSCTEEIMKLTHILWLPLKNSWYSLTTPPLVYASNFSVNPGLFQESVLLLEKVFLGFVVSWSGSVTVRIQSTSSTERPTEASNEKNLLLDSYDVSKHTHTHTHTHTPCSAYTVNITTGSGSMTSRVSLTKTEIQNETWISAHRLTDRIEVISVLWLNKTHFILLEWQETLGENAPNWDNQVMWLTPMRSSFFSCRTKVWWSDVVKWLSRQRVTVTSWPSTQQGADLCQELRLSGSLLTASNTRLCIVSAAKWLV